jgi:hypothetical protein
MFRFDKNTGKYIAQRENEIRFDPVPGKEYQLLG